MSGRSPRARATLRPVSSEDEQELEDRWLLGLRGRSVESVDVHEFSVGVAFGGGFALTIESPANLQPAPRAPKVPALTLNSDGTVSGSDALRSLVGQRVLSSVGFKTGSLRLVFESGAHLLVPFDEHYEAWQLASPTGRRWISLPGGGLTTLPRESA
jgi:hypothetical protein